MIQDIKNSMTISVLDFVIHDAIEQSGLEDPAEIAKHIEHELMAPCQTERSVDTEGGR